MILLSFCSFPWWLGWLLPFLLGLLAGWAIWSKWKGMYADMEARAKGLESKVSGLEADLAACRKARTEIDSDLALTRGRLREKEAELAAAIKQSSAKKDKGTSSGGGSRKGGGTGSVVDAASLASGFAAGSSVPDVSSGLSAGSEGSGGTSTGSGGGGGASTAGKSGNGSSIYSKLSSDDLQIIEGIGPKMESILKENGVNDWSTLAGKSTSEVQDILNKYGDKYKIIDPKTWVQQAGLAASGDWDGLIDLQKRLDTGVDNAVGMTDSKLEKLLIKRGLKRAYKQDDLKAIEGIGPAIEKLMHAAGIMTWRDMANSSAERLQGILNDAGARFKLADPKTWPKQAEMAADGKFAELQEYQDFLQGGR